MAILSNIVGLDIGSHSLKAVEFQQTLRGFEVVALRTLPRSDTDSPLSELVSQFTTMHGLSTDHLVASLPGNRVSTRRFTFPFRDRKRLAQAIPFELEADSLFEIEDVLIDWEIVGGDRNHADTVAAIATRSEVAERLSMLSEAGCEPRTLEAEGLVLGNLSTLFPLDGTRLLVDIGHKKTTCCLLSDGQPVAARTFPVAGAALTLALARDRGISNEQAEQLKCGNGVFDTSIRDAPPEVLRVLDRIGSELLRTIGSIEPIIGQLESGPLNEITLCGGSAQLDRIDDFLSARTQHRTARLGPPVEGHADSLGADTSIVFAPAIALALRGTAQTKTRMNFRQQEFAVRLDLGRYGKDLRWPAILAASAGMLAAVSIGTAITLEERRASNVEQQVAVLYEQIFPGKAMPSNATAALQNEVRSAGERAEFLGVYRGNLSALDLLEEVSKRVPPDLDVLFEELTIDRQIIRMRVYAKSFEAADRLGAELAKFPPFAKARIGAIETDKKRGGKRFTVTINLATENEGSG